MIKQSYFLKTIYFLFIIFITTSWTSKEWTVFSSDKGKFKILCPGKMKDTLKTIESKIGSVDYHTFYYQAESIDADNLAYMVSYCDYPEDTVHSDSLDLLAEFFNATIEAATVSVQGELIYSTEINHKEFPGRLWRIDYAKGNAFIKTKSYVVGSRYYSIQTITLKEKRLNISIDKFLDSFKLLD